MNIQKHKRDTLSFAKKIILAVTVCGLFCFASSSVAIAGNGGQASQVANAAIAGEITGVVQPCGSQSVAGLEVYIPGQSFSAILGDTGSFTLYHVPAGTYQVYVRNGANAVAAVGDVVVEKNKITDLGSIGVCPDDDNDGYDQSNDCNDQDPAINPGAEEICDSIDNNCNAEVDEGDACPACDIGGLCGNNTGECRSAYNSSCECVVDIAPSSEECDGKDNNCDGQTDEGISPIPVPNGEQICSNGSYQIVCNPGSGLCGGSCVDFQTDPSNCGGCARACFFGQICSNGSCENP